MPNTGRGENPSNYFHVVYFITFVDFNFLFYSVLVHFLLVWPALEVWSGLGGAVGLGWAALEVRSGLVWSGLC